MRLSGLNVATNLASVLPTESTLSVLVTFEAPATAGYDELERLAARMTDEAKSAFEKLATDGPLADEVAPLLVAQGESPSAPAADIPRTLVDAWRRGMEEVPGTRVLFLPLGRALGRDLTESEATVLLRDVASRYSQSLKLGVLRVTGKPRAVSSWAVPLVIGLVVLVGIVLLAITRNRVRGRSQGGPRG